ncbi:MAG TPA: hypothetical protein DCG18_06130 [Richelia sp.]|nr:hypothetical protein [Richelia sp.]
MNKQPLLTLLSDFGNCDEYVSVMKGVINKINPSARIIDISHKIPPHNIVAARFCLMSAYDYFPQGTIHIAVVDPEVGGERRGIALELANGFLVGPDNGLFSGILSQHYVITAVELTNNNYWYCYTPSKTFHGRDIFAPVGAHIASGIMLQELGTLIDPTTLVNLNLNQCIYFTDRIVGCIQYIDQFGNLVTNIPSTLLKNKSWYVQIGSLRINSYSTYTEVYLGEILALISSHGWVEIAVNQGNAQLRLQVELGKKISVEW